ncbi:hypothetical protein HAX54_003278, partial [Datura stramonium]|nr:hypothetical protein [Datura stramonium]
QFNIVVNSHDKNHVLDEEIDTLFEEIRIEISIEKLTIKCQPSSLKAFGDADVEKGVLESIKDTEDTILDDSSLCHEEKVDKPTLFECGHIRPHSKHFSTLCSDGEMRMDHSKYKRGSRKKEYDHGSKGIGDKDSRIRKNFSDDGCLAIVLRKLSC